MRFLMMSYSLNDMLSYLPPQLYNCDGNDIPEQMRISEFALIDSKVNPLSGSQFLNEAGHGAADYVIPQTTIGTSSSSAARKLGYPDFSVFQNCDSAALPQVTLLNRTQKLTIPTFSPISGLTNVKRKLVLEEENFKSMVTNDAILRTKKRNNTKNNQSHILEQSENYRRVPSMKRSQKLGDKITILQKLVSPYGKTDTASVLQEAEIYIKQLHTKISNMYEMLSSSAHMNVAATHTQLNHSQDTLFKDTRIHLSVADNLRHRRLCVFPVTIAPGLFASNNNGTIDQASKRRDNVMLCDFET